MIFENSFSTIFLLKMQPCACHTSILTSNNVTLCFSAAIDHFKNKFCGYSMFSTKLIIFCMFLQKKGGRKAIKPHWVGL